jgi:hypothetical protein
LAVRRRSKASRTDSAGNVVGMEIRAPERQDCAAQERSIMVTFP